MLEDFFSTTIIVRGKATKSKILGNPIFDNDSVRAQVHGTSAEIYDVELVIKVALVMASCTCYYFKNEQQNCKHIAAVAYKYIDHLKTATQKIPYSGITSIIDTLPNKLNL